MIIAAKVWHYWISIVLVFSAILMVVGVIGLLMTMLIFAPRSRARGGVVEERVYDDRPATY